jgi:hypothetical protein
MGEHPYTTAEPTQQPATFPDHAISDPAAVTVGGSRYASRNTLTLIIDNDPPHTTRP